MDPVGFIESIEEEGGKTGIALIQLPVSSHSLTAHSHFGKFATRKQVHRNNKYVNTNTHTHTHRLHYLSNVHMVLTLYVYVMFLCRLLLTESRAVCTAEEWFHYATKEYGSNKKPLASVCDEIELTTKLVRRSSVFVSE